MTKDFYIVSFIYTFLILVVAGASFVMVQISQMENKNYEVLDTHSGIIYSARNLSIEDSNDADIHVYNTAWQRTLNMILPADPEGQYQLTLTITRNNFWGREIGQEVYVSYFNMPTNTSDIESLLGR